MALKDTWIDKVDGVDDVSAETPNEIASAVIELENRMEQSETNIDEAKETAEDANTTANSARETSLEAIEKANEASRIAKGANQGIAFDTVASMNTYIQNKKVPSYDGKINIGDFVAFSVDYEMVETTIGPGEDGNGEYGEIGPEQFSLSVNGDVIYADPFNGEYWESPWVSVKGNRAYYIWVADRECYTDELEWEMFAHSDYHYEIFTSNSIVRIAEYTDPIYSEISPYTIPFATSMYIKDVNVPDYWWDGSKPQPLETQKVDLTEYARSEDVESGLQSILDAVNSILEG